MAEFAEVLKQIRRMHDACACGEKAQHRNGKPMCPLYKYQFPCNDIVYFDYEHEDIELAVMAWAKEHPEPVYETWFEYLLRSGVIPENAPAGGEYQWIVESIKNKRITTDIAQKLGIEPKEEKGDEQ